MTIEYDYRGRKGSAPGHITRLKQHSNRHTSQTKPSGHPTQNVPDHPFLVQLIVVQYLESRIDDRVSEDRAFRSLGKYLSRIRCRGFPYREKEQKEEFAQGGVE